MPITVPKSILLQQSRPSPTLTPLYLASGKPSKTSKKLTIISIKLKMSSTKSWINSAKRSPNHLLSWMNLLSNFYSHIQKTIGSYILESSYQDPLRIHCIKNNLVFLNPHRYRSWCLSRQRYPNFQRQRRTLH